MPRVALIAVVALAAAAPTASGGRQSSVLHILVAKLTWGPQPFSDTQVDVALKAAAGFYQTASFGKVSLSYDQTPWLDVLAGPPSCAAVGSYLTLASRLAPPVAAAGYQLGSYNRLVFLLPAANCGFAGLYEPAGVVLNGQLTAGLVVHELGHSLGMGHAGAVLCRYNAASVRFCQSEVYGDPWDVMSANLDMNGGVSGQGGDFGALQKARAGWLTSITYIQSAGIYTLGALEQATSVSQALVIQTAGYQYWVDHREAIGNDTYLASDPKSGVATGFEVHREVGDPDLTQNLEYPLIPDYLLPQGRHNRYITAPGQSFTLPNVFELTALTHHNGQVTIRFRWLDHTRPAAPDVAETNTASTVTLTWPVARDTGTGVKQYLVSIDGATPTAVSAQQTPPYHDQLVGLSTGRHSISVTAVDYAGNRSAATTHTISVG